MKFRYFLTSLVALATLFTGCGKQIIGGDLENISVSNSYVSIPGEGGNAIVEVDAKEAWTLVIPEKATWLTASPMSGSAGKTTVTFTAGEGINTQEAEVKIKVGSNVQYIKVKQQVGTGEAALITVKEASEAPDGKIVMLEGACVEIEESVKYGDWYLQDETGKIYIYGTNYEGEKEKGALEKLGIEIGDIIRVKGEKQLYYGKLELTHVDVLDIRKSLLKVEPAEIKFDKEGTAQNVEVILKGENLDILKPDWISITNYDVKKSIVNIEFTAEPNTGDVRKGEIKFVATSGDDTTTITVVAIQASGVSAYALPFEETFAENQGAFEIDDIVLPEGKTYIWAFASGYGMKASAGVAAKAASDLVSPNIDLTSAENPVLTFEHVSRYAGNVDAELQLYISQDNGANWEQVLIPNYSSGSDWTFVSSGNISLARYTGNIVQLRFSYQSTTEAYATWEIKNLKIEDNSAMTISNIAELNDFAVTDEQEFTATFTDVIVSYVNGKNAFLEDATGGVQLYLTDHGLVAGDNINGTVTGKIKLYHGYAELTALDITSATKTTATAPVKEITLGALVNSYLRYINRAVKVTGVSLNPALTTSNRNTTVKAADDVEIAGYAQVNGAIEIPADTQGSLFCLPTRYNATLQLGIWDSAHFTPAN